jgi:NADH-quinone oxidoreductase subunit A
MDFDIVHFGIMLFLAAGVGVALASLILAALVAPRAKGGDIGMPFECGMRPPGPAWTHFGISSYMYALIFIAFDVDVLYLFPVAAQYHLAEGWPAFGKVAFFLFFLLLALLYFRAKGVFTWQRKISP